MNWRAVTQPDPGVDYTKLANKLGGWFTQNVMAQVPTAAWVILTVSSMVFVSAVTLHAILPDLGWLGLALTALLAGGYRYVLRSQPNPWHRPLAIAGAGFWVSLVWGVGLTWLLAFLEAGATVAVVTWWLNGHQPAQEDEEAGEDMWVDENGHLHRRDTPPPHQRQEAQK